MQDIISFVIKYWYLWASLLAVIFILIRTELTSTVAGILLISPDDVVTKMNHEDAMVVDVRDNNAYANGHILGAHHVMPKDIDDKKHKLAKAKDKPIIVVDAQGQQAPKLAATLREQGLTTLFALKGGMSAWTAAGLPLAKKH